MNDLVKSVNAGVGPSRTEYIDLLREKLPRRVHHLTLYRLGVMLYLPPAITGAFVFDFEFPGRH
jgi:hypothetical protein